LGKIWGKAHAGIAVTLPRKEAAVASLEPRNETYRVDFKFRGRKYGYSLDAGDRDTAEALRGGVEKTLMRVDQNLLPFPDGADVVEFVKHDGRPPQ
jgi:hypothetical protein